MEFFLGCVPGGVFVVAGVGSEAAVEDADEAVGWRPIAIVSHAASALFVVFLLLPWGNATFLLTIVTLFAWLAVVGVRLATNHSG